MEGKSSQLDQPLQDEGSQNPQLTNDESQIKGNFLKL